MEAGRTKRDADRARRGHTGPDKQVGPDQPNRSNSLHPFTSQRDRPYIDKRRRSVEDEDAREHTRKNPRIQESQYPYVHTTVLHVYSQYHLPSAVNTRRHNLKGKIQSQPPRKSPRLQEIHDLRQQRLARAGKRTNSSPRTTKAQHYVGQEQPQAERRGLSVGIYCGCYHLRC